MIAAMATALLLPPLGLILACLLCLLLVWRGWAPGLRLACTACLGLLLLATPMVAGLLAASLEAQVVALTELPPVALAGAIVILGGDGVSTREGPDIGPLTLQRLRAGAALHRRTGLPLLVSGGPILPGEEAVAVLMARSLQADFGAAVRWIEPCARDTWENAAFSAALLRADGISGVLLATHGWHMPRALAAFAHHRMPAAPAPVRLTRVPDGRSFDWLPRADRLGQSWFSIREWVGRAVYALRSSRDAGAVRTSSSPAATACAGPVPFQ